MKKSLLTLLFALLVSMAAWAETTYSKALEEKAILGDADAMLELSTCYRFAMGVKKDLDWANYWLECSAKAGNTKALTVLTSLGDKGTGLKDAKRQELDSKVQKERQKLQDDASIDYSTYNDALYRKAQSGEARAQNSLGLCYHDGKGVTKDYSQAVYWYRKAADQGYASAQYNLGYCYKKGNGVSKDFKQAAQWYRKAAEQGNASAQNGLGYCYRHGEGVDKSDTQAVYWYRKSAEQGNKYGLFNMGFCYENGYGVTKDIDKAIEWYRKAADKGNDDAQDALNRLNGASGDSGNNQTFTVKGVSFTMVYVEGGTFSMGATSEQGTNVSAAERPVHTVYLSDYYIGQTEVTQELWEAVMGTNPSHFKGAKRPVEMVSWNDCQAFVKKLSRLTGKTFRLPTEAEWEYAARGGNKSRGYKYSGSNTLDDVAWHSGNSGKETHPVGTKRANELGIYDMSGNLWERCNDYYDADYYSSSPYLNPKGPATGSFCVCRDGSYSDGDGGYDYFRVSSRVSGNINSGSNFVGFRIAME